MKIIKRIFKKRLRRVVELDEKQMGFVLRRGTIDVNFKMIQMMEEYEVAQRKLYMVLVDLERLLIVSHGK